MSFQPAPVRALLLACVVFILCLGLANTGFSLPPVYAGVLQAVLLALVIGLAMFLWQRSRHAAQGMVLHDVIHALPVAMSMHDAQGQLVLVNSAFAELTGRDVTVLPGQNIAEVLPAALVQQTRAHDGVMMQDKWLQSEALWIARPDGARACIQISRRRLQGSDGKALTLSSYEDITGWQYMVREQAEHSRAFLQRLIDVIPQPVYVKDAQSRYLIVNSTFCEQRKLTPDQIILRPPIEFAGYDPELTARVIAEDKSVLAGERVLKEESFIHRATGEQLDRIVAKGTCLDDEGNPVVVGTNFDTTSWRRVEGELKTALAAQSRMREFLQATFDALPNALFVKDQAHRVIMTNRAHAAFLGTTPEDILGKTSTELIDADHARTVDAFDDEMLEKNDGEVFQKEVEFYDPKGLPRQFIVRKVVHHDAEGKRVILTIHVDITSLRQAEARWQFALEGAGDGIWDWNISENRVFYSTRWKAMLGYDEAEITDSPDERVQRIHPDDVASARTDLQAHLVGRTAVYVSEHRLRCKNGKYRWILDRGRVVERDTDGNAVRVIGTHTDITERKHFEDELRRHRDRLQDLVQEQTADVVLAKEAAERASDAKSLFLANMSHELRTPMHAILSFAHLGETRAAEAAPDKLRGYFERIRTSGDRLLLLLNDLLDLSKLESGSMTIEMREIDLQAVIDDTVNEFDAWLSSRNLRVVQPRTDCDGLVVGNTVRLGQVVRNLLSNAIKFSPEGSQITLMLQAAKLTQVGHVADADELAAVELVVADRGPGIPKSEINTIFDKFVQGATAQTGAGGTGLGLTICREIVAAHRGEIFARNRDNGGAELIIRIPAASARSSLAAADQADAEASGKSPHLRLIR